jgi:hypothetical protein
MLGMPVTSFPSNTTTATVRLNHPERVRAGVDPTGQRLPAYVEGEIENLPEDMEASDLAIVIAINGVIRSTTKTTQAMISSLTPEGGTPSKPPNGESSAISREGDGVHFLMRVPPGTFARGKNEVTIHGVVEDEQGRPTALLDFAQQ